MNSFAPKTPLSTHDAQAIADESPRLSGPGRLLVVVYAILALAATGRSVFQIGMKLDHAPLPYTLSAVAAAVYIVATIALVRHHLHGWHRVAVWAITFELIGVVVVGALTIFAPDLFVPRDAATGEHEGTVWGFFGRDYGFVPLVLPLLGLWWLGRHRPGPQAAESAGASGAHDTGGRG